MWNHEVHVFGHGFQLFDDLYRSTDDPFGAALPQYRYQRRKYRALISMLPRRAYRNALDIGCGLGVFTRALAPHVAHVTGLDISPHAVAQATALSASLPNIDYRAGDVASLATETERYDLIVLADVVYYLMPFDDIVIARLAAMLAALLTPDGLLLLVDHYFFTIDPPSRMTRHIHDLVRNDAGLEPIAEYRRSFYLATLLQCST